MTIFFQDLDGGFYIQDNKEEHITTIRSEAERVIDRTLPVCHPLTEIMGVQHYRSYEAFLLGGSAGRPHFLCSRSLFFSSDPFLLLLLFYFLLCLGRTADCPAVEKHRGGL